MVGDAEVKERSPAVISHSDVKESTVRETEIKERSQSQCYCSATRERGRGGVGGGE